MNIYTLSTVNLRVAYAFHKKQSLPATPSTHWFL